MTLWAPHASNVPPRERQLFAAPSQPPLPQLQSVRGYPHPSADLNALPFLAPPQRG